MVAEGFPCDGVVTEERLRLLLAQQTESPSLDYKIECDLSSTKGKLELVKDCAAMMSRPEGGYLVIGADGNGKPAGTAIDTAMFDESRIRPLLEKHLGVGVIVRSQTHEINGTRVTVLFAGRRADGLFPIVKGDATYQDDNGDSITALSRGDVFVRDGTSAVRWRTQDLPDLLAPYVASIRAEERDRIGEIMEKTSVAARGQDLAKGPIGTLTWNLSDEDFKNALIEAIRTDDRVVIQLSLIEMKNEGVGLAAQTPTGPTDKLLRLLDRAATALALSVIFDHPRTTALALDTLKSIYTSQTLTDGASPNSQSVSSQVWLEIAKRVLGVLALCVRLGAWASFRQICLVPIGKSYVLNWLRHATVWAYRGKIMPTGDTGGEIQGAFVALSRHVIQDVPALRLDMPAAAPPTSIGAAPAEIDPLLDSVCQADYLACVLIALEGCGSYSPSFSGLFPHRVEPLITLLNTGEDARAKLFPNSPAEEVSAAMEAVRDTAGQQAPYFW